MDQYTVVAVFQVKANNEEDAKQAVEELMKYTDDLKAIVVKEDFVR